MKEEYSLLRYYCRAISPLYEFALGFKECLRSSNPSLGREVVLKRLLLIHRGSHVVLAQAVLHININLFFNKRTIK